jgi:hypothetical protein
MPETYYEWALLLDKFGDGDDSVMSQLEKGKFTVDAGTANRFYLKVKDNYTRRKKLWLSKFQKSFEFSLLRNISEFEVSLRNAKKNLVPLHKYVSLHGFPRDLTETLKKDLHEFVLEIKNALSKNAVKITNDRDQIMLMISSFGLPITNDDLDQGEPRRDPPSEVESNGGRRNIIF